ncbi:hypothetical protein [Bacillus alkalicellulosilyticus]|uniref:hypothetical protein n=1 Tax=Alkalihalobacterium alkalicellulosilyticum TaxID=1912214 RepID=UPI000996ACDD|nr:hypothetical protein [Bacillus alkalicellulosilyticus]
MVIEQILLLLVSSCIVLFCVFNILSIRKQKVKPRLLLVPQSKRKRPLLSVKKDNELKKLAFDQEHYLFLVALEEGRVTEKEYDDWVHSRSSEGMTVVKQLLKRPYTTRRL